MKKWFGQLVFDFVEKYLIHLDGVNFDTMNTRVKQARCPHLVSCGHEWSSWCQARGKTWR